MLEGSPLCPAVVVALSGEGRFPGVGIEALGSGSKLRREAGRTGALLLVKEPVGVLLPERSTGTRPL